MAQEKQKPCCARKVAKLHADQANLRSLAQKAASHDARGHDITRLKGMIVAAKILIVKDREAITDHEADHAAELQWASA